ncbi:hypothetical protein ROHU_019523 [Labeo rohita]|uniref:Uncharacterized protein n=1 Tax=Labeo rohita TaxID=84645 RepID=A0A498NE97_LABRO|nr:hypothetical protein ROHU_005738 [Labeo rohita]RXN28197.1 hypothetical protein ROHU_019523 [Labeo rohita]
MATATVSDEATPQSRGRLMDVSQCWWLDSSLGRRSWQFPKFPTTSEPPTLEKQKLPPVHGNTLEYLRWAERATRQCL